MRVMVVGARPRSLGAAVCDTLEAAGYTAVPVGVTGESGGSFDVLSLSVEDMVGRMQAVRPHHVVCTVGMNDPWFRGMDVAAWYANHLVLNAIGPMKVLEAFDTYCDLPGNRQRTEAQHYVAISSNSAHIPRTASGAYCASKAALSMALRCKARELGKARSVVIAYGYEPGLLAGTPMTDSVRLDLGAGNGEDVDPDAPPLHRMPGVGPQGIEPMRLANMVVQNLEGGRELNGCLFRVDAGEL